MFSYDIVLSKLTDAKRSKLSELCSFNAVIV